MMRTMSVQFGGGRRRGLRIVLYTLLAAGTTFAAFLGVQLVAFSQSTEVEAKPVVKRRTEGGTLVICGGGKTSDLVRSRFMELAGGPKARIIIIPTADPSAERTVSANVLDPWLALKPEHVEFLHTRSRETADDPKFVKPLTEATGVWIGGGDQTRLTQAYLGTKVERQLMALLNRGGVIGGSSAGAAVMTRVMIVRGRDHATVSPGFDFLPGAVVDQHFLRRNRISRLVGVLADHPDLIGLGIDERAALEVSLPDRHLRVIGDSYVFACVPDNTGHPARLEILKPGDEADLAGLKDKDHGQAIVSAIDFQSL